MVILAWDDKRVDMKAMPECHCFIEKDGRIARWAPGYENSGSLAYDRWFPIMYLCKKPCPGWMHARDFFEFDDKKLSQISRVRGRHAYLQKEPSNSQLEPSTKFGGLEVKKSRTWWDTVLI